MVACAVLRTERLVLRDWRDSDVDPMTAMNQDRDVMEFYPALRTRDETVAMIAQTRLALAVDGFGFWAVEVPGVHDFIGYVGISPVTFDAPFTPAVEIGWRLARHAWGHGYATEAARAVLAAGWTTGLDEIVAFLVPANRRSAAVAERIGMTRDPAGDFDHPRVTVEKAVGGSPILRHVLYRIRRQTAPAQGVGAAKS
jgi:RimJ/RimL family protein N-acetyltransferase